MAETVTLTTPIAKPTQTLVKIQRITIDVEQKSLLIQWIGDNNEPGSASYPTPAPQGSSQPTGAQLLTILNTANLTSNSLVRRTITRLQTDGYIPAGTISGVAD